METILMCVLIHNRNVTMPKWNLGEPILVARNSAKAMSSDEDGGGGGGGASSRRRRRAREKKKEEEKKKLDAAPAAPVAAAAPAAPKPVRKFTLRDQPQAPLQARESSAIAEIAQEVGKVRTLGGAAALEVGTAAPEAGFFCEKCGKLLKDSQAWLGHLNSKKRKVSDFVLSRLILGFRSNNERNGNASCQSIKRRSRRKAEKS
jgi:pyruvate/2-oxoglutarate dehydrogenase complex dihydrolipoamide acyltransferase (E2) component